MSPSFLRSAQLADDAVCAHYRLVFHDVKPFVPGEKLLLLHCRLANPVRRAVDEALAAPQRHAPRMDGL